MQYSLVSFFSLSLLLLVVVVVEIIFFFLDFVVSFSSSARFRLCGEAAEVAVEAEPRWWCWEL